jgi:hypothetical protein
MRRAQAKADRVSRTRELCSKARQTRQVKERDSPRPALLTDGLSQLMALVATGGDCKPSVLVQDASGVDWNRGFLGGLRLRC